MTDVNTTYTSLKDAINICLSCIGETPVDAPNNTSTNVVLSKQIIEEVSRDVQSKGWWFNTSGSSISILSTTSGTDTDGNASFDGSIPEEARRYISIRAARVLQSRFVGSEELQKFSFQEEQVSLAILTQAHVRNGGNSTSFTAFPAELKAMGIEEVMFLQQSAEEKLLSLRLKTELKQAEKLASEKDLVDAQKSQVQTETVLRSQQALTELEETSKRAAEKLLVDEQAGLITNQAATELKKALDLVADTTIKGKQGTLIDNQAATELKNALKVVAETSLLNDQEALVVNQAATELKKALDIAADTTLKGKQGSLIDNQAATELKRALDLVADTTLKGKQGSLVDAQALDVAADTTLKGKQGALIDAQELKTDAEKLLVDAQALDVAADTTLKGKQGSLVDAQATDVAADTTLKGKQGALVDAQELKTDAEAALIASQTTTDATQRTLIAAQELKTDAETILTGKQGSLVDAQATDVAADTTLKGKQGALIDAQELKTDAETTLTSNQSDLIASQKTELDAKTAIEVAAEKAFYDGVVAGTQETYRDYAAEMRIMGVQESIFQQTPAYKKVELIKDANKLRTVTATETGTDATELSEVNKIMRLIGEPPIAALNDNSLASECVRLLRDTDKELQGRGWWFNTEEDVELTPTGTRLEVPSSALSVELNDYATRITTVGGIRYIYDIKKQSYSSWKGSEKAKIIYQRDLTETPSKYREYLNVRVAILLTELYPQSGIDIQRLPKMEAELRAYFKDRDFDDASYSVFDSYDVAIRMGINRNYNLA